MWFVGYCVLEVVEFIWTRVEARDRFYRGGCFDNETPLIEGVTTCAQMYLGVIERAPLVRSMWVIVAIAIHREHNRVRCLSKGQTAEQETKASTEDENTENEGLFHRCTFFAWICSTALERGPLGCMARDCSLQCVVG